MKRILSCDSFECGEYRLCKICDNCITEAVKSITEEQCDKCEHRCPICGGTCSECHLPCDNRRKYYYNPARFI